MKHTNKRNYNKVLDLLFDEELYKELYSTERTNGWIDSYKSLFNCFKTTIISGIGFNFFAFITIALKEWL